jgi:hypothetical protein
MARTAQSASSLVFDFDYYRFNGKGNTPTVVPNVAQANFMRTRYSIPEALVNLATERAQKWARDNGVSLNSKEPYPSSQKDRYWLEFRFGGLTL